MRIQSPTVMKLGGMAIASITRHWMSTLEYKALYYDRRIDPTVRDFGGPAIFLFWHEYIPFLFYLRGHCNLAMLLSRHQDAEWLSQASRHMGFQTVRGSTNRGGVAALRELLRKSRSMRSWCCRLKFIELTKSKRPCSISSRHWASPMGLAAGMTMISPLISPWAAALSSFCTSA